MSPTARGGAMLRALVISALAMLVVAVGSASSAPAGEPVNGRIVFATNDGMASVNPDGSGAWGLRFTRIGRGTPAWSPDGAAIAFTEAGGQGIFLMDPDGTAVRPLVQVPGATNPAWSPDGTTIAFDDGFRLYTVNRDGTGVAAVAEGASPTWSPDGKRIAYAASGDIHVLELASRLTSRLTVWPGYDDQPAWSPSGSSIVFVSDREGAVALYSMAPDGSGQTRVTRGPTYDTEPAWSPDGAEITFVRNGQVWLARSDGSDARQLIHGSDILYGGSWSASPAWQPLPNMPAECTLAGTFANDLLVGSEDPDVICGGAGADTVLGMGGDDLLRGGDGDDWIAGGSGDDAMLGEGGADRLDARDGEGDTVDGNEGPDIAVVDAR